MTHHHQSRQGPGNLTRRAWAVPRLVLLAMALTAVAMAGGNSLWANSVDLGLHYALVVRITDLGHAPTTVDPSLGLMNGYPPASHTLAALLGKGLGSPFAGMHLTAVLSLAALYASLGFVLGSAPRQHLAVLWLAVPATLVLNRLIVHLELFGTEIIGNFFFAQLVAQAAAMAVLAAALAAEQAGHSHTLRYALLGFSVPILAQIHPLPALEILVVLCLLFMQDYLRASRGLRGTLLMPGLLIVIASVLITTLGPAFAAIRRNAENDGALPLIYTPNVTGMVILSGVVMLLSIILLAFWFRSSTSGVEPQNLVHKYWALLGLAIAALCLFQAIMLMLGLGSPYAVKKYALGLNTVLLLDVPVLLVASRVIRPLARRAGWPDRAASLAWSSFPAWFLVVAVFTLLPPVSARIASVDEIRPLERFAMAHRDPHPGINAGKYDYAVGLYPPARVIDFMISIGALQAPQARNVEDFLWGRPLSNPRRIGRLFSRVGSLPWDVPGCRNLVLPEGFEILDGSCVLKIVQGPSE